MPTREDSTDVIARLDQIDARISELRDLMVHQRQVKDFYTTAEVAELLDRDPYTVREWARAKRIKAVKRLCGRGRAKDWVVSHEELERIRNHGLLPLT